MLNHAEKLVPCAAISLKVCTKEPDNVTEISPNPLPTKIIMKLKFFEVVSVDETKHPVTLSFKTMVDWQDHMLDVNRSIDRSEQFLKENAFLTHSWKFLRPNALDQLQFKLEKNN